MEDFFSDCETKISEIETLFIKVQDYINGKEIKKSLHDRIVSLDNALIRFADTHNDGITKFSKTVQMVSVHSNMLAKQLLNIDDGEMKKISFKMQELSSYLKDKIENITLTYNSSNVDDIDDLGKNNLELELEKRFVRSDHNLDALIKNLKDQNLSLKDSITDYEVRLKNLSIKSEKVEEKILEEVSKASALYEQSKEYLDEQKAEVDSVTSHIAGRAIAGDYETSAENERVMADLLRYASIFIMILIVIVVGYSFWETTQDDFKWETSIYRLVLAIFLSIPSAYLARESTKHRAQQYNHQQKSLDLKAISPYIASLPEPIQHKIKTEIAARLFAAKDFGDFKSDSYPINTHEMLMEILKKIDINDKKEKKE